MSKFSVGEVAGITGYSHPLAIARYGSRAECTVIDKGSWKNSDRHPKVLGLCYTNADYVVQMPDGECWFAQERNLIKRRPPSEQHFRTELKSADPSLWPPGIDIDRLTNPVPAEREVREKLKGILQPFDGFEGNWGATKI